MQAMTIFLTPSPLLFADEARSAGRGRDVHMHRRGVVKNRSRSGECVNGIREVPGERLQTSYSPKRK